MCSKIADAANPLHFMIFNFHGCLFSTCIGQIRMISFISLRPIILVTHIPQLDGPRGFVHIKRR